jgi:3-deoxy-D-manno-octulosonic-acid transferase
MLGDSLGEMAVYYAAADAVLIGGSLLPFGCQNLIEVCAAGAPLLIGPSTYNFAQAAELAQACGAALPVHDAAELMAQLRRLLDSPEEREAMRDAGRRFVAEHRGATGRLLAWLAPRLGNSR